MNTTLKEFEPVFINKIVPELVQDARSRGMPEESVKWYERVGFSIDGALAKLYLC